MINTDLTQILSPKELQLINLQYTNDISSSIQLHNVQVHLYDINNNIVGSLYNINSYLKYYEGINPYTQDNTIWQGGSISSEDQYDQGRDPSLITSSIPY